MHPFDLLLTLAICLAGALALGYWTHRLGWSSIVGYLLAGVLLGPHTPGIVANRQMAEELADVGVILLMFGVGLQFHWKDLLAVRKIAVAGALVQSAAATGIATLASHSWGWSWKQGIVFGLALSVASTVVLVRVLADQGQLQSAAGRIAVGWLVVEDIFTVLVLVLLPLLAQSDAKPDAVFSAILVAGVKLGAFIGFMLVAGSHVIPWFLSKVAETHSRELFTLSILTIALGIAVASAHFFRVSTALGAFLAGMVVGQSEFSARAGSEAMPLRDAFAVMFFLSVGMLLDPRQAMASPLPIAATLAIVMVGKPAAGMIITALLGYGSRIALGVALALGQIGEFSFLLAKLGRDVGALPEAAMNPIVAAAVFSILLNPFVYRGAERAERILQQHPRWWRLLNRTAAAHPETAIEPPKSHLPHHAVIVGYGPIGRLVARILRQRGIEPTIIEMNLDTCRKLRSEGHRAVYGDATRKNVLEQAGLAHADTLILSASGMAGSADAVRAALEMNPRIQIVARADYLRETEVLRRAGASNVFSGEGEVALAIADRVLRRLGATAEQLDEVRERIRRDLLNTGE
jgi:CPA2 family monovalent cation:H+ antiporter-2